MGEGFPCLQLANTSPPMVARVVFKKSRRERFFDPRSSFKIFSCESIQQNNHLAWRTKLCGNPFCILLLHAYKMRRRGYAWDCQG